MIPSLKKVKSTNFLDEDLVDEIVRRIALKLTYKKCVKMDFKKISFKHNNDYIFRTTFLLSPQSWNCKKK